MPGRARGRPLQQLQGLPHQEVGLEQQTAATGAYSLVILLVQAYYGPFAARSAF